MSKTPTPRLNVNKLQKMSSKANVKKCHLSSEKIRKMSTMFILNSSPSILYPTNRFVHWLFRSLAILCIRLRLLVLTTTSSITPSATSSIPKSFASSSPTLFCCACRALLLSHDQHRFWCTDYSSPPMPPLRLMDKDLTLKLPRQRNSPRVKRSRPQEIDGSHP